jgi:hypothetical protein
MGFFPKFQFRPQHFFRSYSVIPRLSLFVIIRAALFHLYVWSFLCSVTKIAGDVAKSPIHCFLTVDPLNSR